MSTALDAFIAEARAVTVADAAQRLGLLPAGRLSIARPCPVCGGQDRFSIDARKNAWNCRGEGRGGRDAISLFAHVNGHDVETRSGFVMACAEALNRAPPVEQALESEAERQARLERMAARKKAAEKTSAAADKKAADFRAREIDRARGIFKTCFEAPGRHAHDRIVDAYLSARTAVAASDALFANLCGGSVTYWHGQDEMGRPAAIYQGAAMVAPFVTLDRRIVGCHITWIDMSNPDGKFRPSLWGLTDEGRAAGWAAWQADFAPPSTEAIARGFYEKLPVKKMRGQKKGGVIPLHGEMDAARWMVGEGIENVVFVAAMDGWRDDTFYAAAGDIGNIAGPADPASAFNHPSMTLTDKRDRTRPVRVAGPVPKPESRSEAYQLPEHVTDVIHLVDGDSEPVFTASAMARAEARLARPGRVISEWPAPEGMDWTDVAAGGIA
jgi:Zinc-binding domain of primase-helicase